MSSAKPRTRRPVSVPASRVRSSVSKSAPSELKDDWSTLLAYAKKARDAKGDTAKLTELSKSEGAKMGEASSAIAKHAKDTCKIDLENP